MEHRPGINGAPLLAGAAATFECFNRSQYKEGDHTIFVGEVERFANTAKVLRPCCTTGASFIPSTRCRARPLLPCY